MRYQLAGSRQWCETRSLLQEELTVARARDGLDARGEVRAEQPREHAIAAHADAAVHAGTRDGDARLPQRLRPPMLSCLTS